MLKVSRIWEEDKGCKKKLKTVHFLKKSDVHHPSEEWPHLDIFKNHSHYENSIELGHSKLVQLDQLDPSFHNLCSFTTCVVLVNMVRAQQDVEWIMSNSLISPIMITMISRIWFYLSHFHDACSLNQVAMYFLISYAECLAPTGKKNHPLFLFEYSVFSLKQTSELTAVGCYYQQTRERKVEIIF